MASVFISYQRRPSALLAELIVRDLRAQGIEVYLDVERVETAGNFPTRLIQAIDSADVFVCLVADTTFESEWVQREIEHASKRDKPMIPVFQESYTPIPLDKAPTPYIKDLLEHDGVQVFDIKNVYLKVAIESLAQMIENTVAWLNQPPPAPPTPSQAQISLSIDNLTGQKIGQYEVREMLGMGGMGAVYRAYQSGLRRDVAMKVLPPTLAQQSEFIERFAREAQTAAALEHSHIVPVYDYGTYGGLSYVVMRLLTGGSLAERLSYRAKAEHNLPSLGETAIVLRDLSSALDYAHSRGVIHRDIKANNVMFDDQGSAFLVDFGIAKITTATTGLTGTGMMMGTPPYMAPEQWKGESITPATDQYALGVMIYNMVTGRLPFEAPTPYAFMHKHLHEEAAPPETWRSNLPPSMKAVLKQAMAKSPRDRFPSAKDFADAFAESIRGLEDRPTDFFTEPLPNRPTPVSVLGTPKSKPAITPTPKPPLPTSEKPPTPAPATAMPKDADYSPTVTPSKAIPIDGDTSKIAAAVPTPPGKGRNWMVWGAAGVAVLLLAVAAFAIFTSGSNQAASATGTAAALAARSASETETREAERTQEPTVTALIVVIQPTETPTSTRTPTPTDTATATLTRTPTRTPSPTPTITPSATDTLDAVAVAQATYGAIQTTTAESWTATPTPNATQTLNAALTALFAQDLTATATLWTHTPTATPTDTATPTATPTDTPTPTLTPTPTPTASPTNTVTPLPSATPEPTRVAGAIVCPGALPTFLYAGLQGYVRSEDPRPVNVRNGPGIASTKIGEIPANGTFEVLEGPQCADQITWYRVNYGGLEGWIAEGDDSYFVSPIDSAAPTPRPDVVLTNCTALVEDDFIGGVSRNQWFVDNRDGTRSNERIIEGAYELRLNFMPANVNELTTWGSLQGYSFRSRRVEAVIRVSSFSDVTTRTGLWLRYQNEQNFLAFMIRNNGSYYIGRYQDDYIDIVPWTQSRAIRTGDNAVNTLRVDIQDDRFTFFVNGVQLTTITDSTWPEGRLAFFVSSREAPVSAQLDYVRICQM